MIKRITIVLVMLLPLRVLAMTVEEQQRFTYYFYEAERLWQSEHYAEAFVLFEFCNALNPNDAITNRYLGHIYKGCKLEGQALPFYRRAWENAPTECWKEYAVALYNSGELNCRKEAIRVMQSTSKLIPAEADLWDNMRDAYLGVHKYNKALWAQNQLDKVEGYDAYSAINRYRICLMRNRPKKAIAEIEHYLEEDPANLQFQLYRVQLYEATRQPMHKMIAMYQQVLALDPMNALVLNNYAYLLSTHRGDLKMAEKMSAKAVQAEPQNPTYLDTYAWILYLSDQNELAKLYIRQAVSLFGDELPKEVLEHSKKINR